MKNNIKRRKGIQNHIPCRKPPIISISIPAVDRPGNYPFSYSIPIVILMLRTYTMDNGDKPHTKNVFQLTWDDVIETESCGFRQRRKNNLMFGSCQETKGLESDETLPSVFLVEKMSHYVKPQLYIHRRCPVLQAQLEFRL